MLKEYGKYYIFILIVVIAVSWVYALAVDIDVSAKNIKIEFIILIGFGILSGTHSILSIKNGFVLNYSEFSRKHSKIYRSKSPELYYIMVIVFFSVSVLLTGYGAWALINIS